MSCEFLTEDEVVVLEELSPGVNIKVKVPYRICSLSGEHCISPKDVEPNKKEGCAYYNSFKRSGCLPSSS